MNQPSKLEDGEFFSSLLSWEIVKQSLGSALNETARITVWNGNAPEPPRTDSGLEAR